MPVVHAALLQPRKVAPPLQPSTAEHVVQHRTPQRILIADDNADSAESMGMLLRLMGNDVRIASDGLEAVEQAAVFQPDIVLLDIGMPRLDGYEAARRIRNQGWARDTLLVAVTGWGPSDADEQATAAGLRPAFHEAARSGGVAAARHRTPPALTSPTEARKRDRARGRRLRRVRSARNNRWRRTLGRRDR